MPMKRGIQLGSFPGTLIKILLCFALMAQAALGLDVAKLPKSANDLLRAEKRLKLTPRQKVKISQIYTWALMGIDRLVRDEEDEAVIQAKANALYAKSLKSGLKVLTPKQRSLWKKFQLPDPKIPKRAPK